MSKVALGRMLHFRDSTNCRTRNADHEDYTLDGEMLDLMSMIMILVKQCPLLRCWECRCEWGSAEENLRSLPHPLSVWGHGLRFHFQPFTFAPISLSVQQQSMLYVHYVHSGAVADVEVLRCTLWRQLSSSSSKPALALWQTIARSGALGRSYRDRMSCLVMRKSKGLNYKWENTNT